MVTLDFDLAMADRDYVDYGWFDADADIRERNEYIRECRLFLFSTLGAFVLDGQLIYWRIKTAITMVARLLIPRQCHYYKRRLSKGLHITRDIGSRWY